MPMLLQRMLLSSLLCATWEDKNRQRCVVRLRVVRGADCGWEERVEKKGATILWIR